MRGHTPCCLGLARLSRACRREQTGLLWYPCKSGMGFVRQPVNRPACALTIPTLQGALPAPNAKQRTGGQPTRLINRIKLTTCPSYDELPDNNGSYCAAKVKGMHTSDTTTLSCCPRCRRRLQPVGFSRMPSPRRTVDGVSDLNPKIED